MTLGGVSHKPPCFFGGIRHQIQRFCPRNPRIGQRVFVMTIIQERPFKGRSHACDYRNHFDFSLELRFIHQRIDAFA